MKFYLVLLSAAGVATTLAVRSASNELPAAAYLATLPDGVEKSQFIVPQNAITRYLFNSFRPFERIRGAKLPAHTPAEEMPAIST